MAPTREGRPSVTLTPDLVHDAFAGSHCPPEGSSAVTERPVAVDTPTVFTHAAPHRVDILTRVTGHGGTEISGLR